MRPWRAEDREPFYAMNVEADVQRFLSPLTRAGSDQMLDRIDQQFQSHGWGFWALEEKQSGQLIGLCGIAQLSWDPPFGMAVELSWRLSSNWQGRGFAREAAEASIYFGLEMLKLERLVGFTVPANTTSWGLMERLGMRKVGGFEYPLTPVGHPLRTQILYEITLSDLRRDY